MSWGLAVWLLAAVADAGCQTAADLVLCEHLNGKKISTRASLKKFDSGAQVITALPCPRFPHRCSAPQSVFTFLLTEATTPDAAGCKVCRRPLPALYER